MTLRSRRLLACFLSLLCASSLLAADPPATNGHFQIAKSFPVSEATWAEKGGDLYLVAARRVTNSPYATFYRWPATTIGTNLYLAEGNGGVGVFVTTDIDGVWQLDWEAAGGPKATRRIPLKGLSEDLTLRGNYVYVANGIGRATIDVSDPANPTLVSDVAVPNGKSTPGNAFSPDGNYLVVVAGGQFSVYSIRNAASPQVLQTFTGHGSKGVDEFRLVPRLSASRSGNGGVSIEWEGVGQLQAAPGAAGPWDPIPGAVNPHRSSNEPAQCFRVKVQ